MRRATLIGMVLIGLVLVVTSSLWACGYRGRCYVPCGRLTCCAPVYCVPVCCVPVVCEPACCEPATVTPAKAADPAQKQPTLAPPEAKEQKVAPPLASEAPKPEPAKKTEARQPVEVPALPSLTTPEAKQEKLPKIPAVPSSGPEAPPTERPASISSEKPLVAEYTNPFILETDQLQIWTDASGDYRVEARFVSFDEKTVRLQRSNGQFVRVAYNRLSLADRERVRDLSLAVAMKTSMK